MKLRPIRWLLQGVKVGKETQWMVSLLIGPHESKEEALKTQKHLEQVIGESNDDTLLMQDKGILS